MQAVGAQDGARPASDPPGAASGWARAADFWWQSAWFLLVAMVVADVLTDVVPVAGAIGTMLWLLSYVYVIAFALLAARDLIRSSFRAAAPFAPFVVSMYLVIAVVNVASPRSYSSETAIEIGCAVHYLNAGGSLGFHQTCLFGYPMRQFLLPVLPSYLFGPSLLDMNAGGSVYFLLGAVIFAAGATRMFRSPYMGNLMAALLLSVFLQLHWWEHFYLIFEQSIFPLSLALIMCGLFLYYRVGDERRVLPLAGLVLLWVIGAYPPSLAVYGLAAVGLVYVAYVRPTIRFPALALLALSLISLLVSLGYRQDLKIGSGAAMNVRGDLWTGFENLVYQNHGVPWTSPLLVFPLVLGVALAISGVLGRLAVPVGLWVVGVFAFAIVAHGFSLNSVDVRMHRALVAIPILLALGAVAMSNRRLSRLRNPLEILLLVSVLTGVQYYYDYRQSVPSTPALPFIYWVEQHVPNRGTPSSPVTMTWFPGTNLDMPGATDGLTYFSPDLRISFLNPSQLGPGCPGLQGLSGIIVAQEGVPCFRNLQKESSSGKALFVGTYTTTTMHLAIFTT